MAGEASRLVRTGRRFDTNDASPPQIAGDNDSERSPGLAFGLFWGKALMLDATLSSAVPPGAAFLH
jgi:hypothetical protein